MISRKNIQAYHPPKLGGVGSIVLKERSPAKADKQSGSSGHSRMQSSTAIGRPSPKPDVQTPPRALLSWETNFFWLDVRSSRYQHLLGCVCVRPRQCFAMGKLVVVEISAMCAFCLCSCDWDDWLSTTATADHQRRL